MVKSFYIESWLEVAVTLTLVILLNGEKHLRKNNSTDFVPNKEYYTMLRGHYCAGSTQKLADS